VSQSVRIFAAAVASVTVLTVAGCDGLPGRPDVTKREVVPVEVTAFDALYRRSCAGCHGSDGRLGAARPLNDPVYLALVPADRLRTIISEGVPGSSMPAFGTAAGGELTDAQVEALAHGMLARWGRAEAVHGVTLPPYGAPPGASDPGAQERGAAVYVRACARCHGPDGRGGPKGGPIVDPAYLALVSNQSLRSTVIAGRADLGQPDWRDDVPGHPLTPEEITDVVTWLAAHREPVPGRLVLGRESSGRQP
jgi:cytochrome c oxidase cbb3-type subunit III